MLAARIIILTGSIILIGTAVFHGTGYRDVSAATAAPALKPFLRSVTKALWLDYSIHLLLIAVISIFLGLKLNSRTGVILCAVVPLVDSILLARFVGLFPGVFLLAAAAALLILGAILLPSGAGA